MGNDDLTNALLRAQGVQGFMGGGMAAHSMPDGTVMPGATHGQYQAMGMQAGGPAQSLSPELLERINRFAGGQEGSLRFEPPAGVNPGIPDPSLSMPLIHVPKDSPLDNPSAPGNRAIMDLLQEPNAQPNREMELFQQASPVDPAQALQEAIQQLEIQKTQTSDPDEIKVLDRMIESASGVATAPLGGMAAQIQSQGRGEDTSLAHLRPGEVIIPPEAFEDGQFEDVVDSKFKELGIDPMSMISAAGVASLNPITGLEEFGWRETARKVAKYAQYIPGPWQPVAALVDKAGTVYDVAKGRASPASLLTLAGPLRTGPSIGDSVSAIKDRSDTGGFWGGLGKSFGAMPGALAAGVSNLVESPWGSVSNLFRSQNPDDYAKDSSDNWVNKITGEGLPAGITGKA